MFEMMVEAVPPEPFVWTPPAERAAADEARIKSETVAAERAAAEPTSTPPDSGHTRPVADSPTMSVWDQELPDSMIA